MYDDNYSPRKIMSTQEMINQIDDDFEIPNSAMSSIPQEKKDIYNSQTTTVKETQESDIKNLDNNISNNKENDDKNIIYTSFKNYKENNINSMKINSISNNINLIHNHQNKFEKNNININNKINPSKLDKNQKPNNFNKISTAIKASAFPAQKQVPNPIPRTQVDCVSDLKQFKILYHNTELFMVKIGKYAESQIIILCYEYSEEKEPNFYYQNIYSLQDLINMSQSFILCQKRDDLFKTLANIFKNDRARISKDVLDNKTIKIIMKIILPDGDESSIILKLSRKEKIYNENFYDSYISFEKQVEREQAQPKRKNSWQNENDDLYNFDDGKSPHTQIYDGSQMAYLNKANIEKNFFGENITRGIFPDTGYEGGRAQNLHISKDRLAAEDREIEKNMKDIRKWNKNLPSDVLIRIFNRLYKTSLNLDDKDLNLSHKSLLTDGLMKLCFIKFKCVQKLYINNNSIYHLNDLPNSSFDHLRILSLHDNNLKNLDPLGRCKFLPFLTELYLYNNAIETLDGLSGAEFNELTILHLFNNNINDIGAFKTMKFEKLAKLLLYCNKIESIEAFGDCNLKTIRSLILYDNKIVDIEPLAKCQFECLNELLINKNKIISLEPLSRCNWNRLGTFLMQTNLVSNIEPLERCKFGNLRILYIYGNRISKSQKKNQEIVKILKARNRGTTLKW